MIPKSGTPLVMGFYVALGLGSLIPLGGCNTGGGLPQQLEPTKPRMDREKETDRPAPKAENAKAFGSQ